MNIMHAVNEIYAAHKQYAPANSTFHWRISLQYAPELQKAMPEAWSANLGDEPLLMGYRIVWDTRATRRIISLDRMAKI